MPLQTSKVFCSHFISAQSFFKDRAAAPFKVLRSKNPDILCCIQPRFVPNETFLRRQIQQLHEPAPRHTPPGKSASLLELIKTGGVFAADLFWGIYGKSVLNNAERCGGA